MTTTTGATPATRHAIIPAVHLLLTDPQRGILLLRRANTSFYDGHYSVPAGHVETGETATAALAREVAEEIGLHLEPEQLQFCLVIHRRTPHAERVDFFFTATGWTGEPVNREPGKCDDLAWHQPASLPPNMVPYVRAAIGHQQAGHAYAEFGWDLLPER